MQRCTPPPQGVEGAEYRFDGATHAALPLPHPLDRSESFQERVAAFSERPCSVGLYLRLWVEGLSSANLHRLGHERGLSRRPPFVGPLQ